MNVSEPAYNGKGECDAAGGWDTSALGQRWIRRAQGRWSWHLRSDWARVLDAPDAPDWANLKDDSRAELVKANDGRQVWRVQWGKHLLFAKVCRPGRSWPVVRRWLFGPDAVREKRVADYAAAHGVKTVTPIAVATAPFRRREPVSILITLGLPHATALNEFWSQINDLPNTRQKRNEVIDAAARLIACAHENGLEHSDLHAGNVLIEANGQLPCQALFVDLINIRTRRLVGTDAMLRNLAQFNQWFRSHATVTDRVRFLVRYLDWRQTIRGNGSEKQAPEQGLRRLLALMEGAAADHANALYSKRDRRTLRTGRYFAKLRLRHGWHAHVFLECKHPVEGSPVSLAKFSLEQWKAWLRSPEEWIRGNRRDYVLKDSPSALVYRTRLETGEGKGIDVICKRSLPRSLLKRALLLFRPSRPMRTWLLANALLNRQIPTARPLAVAERRILGRPVDAFLITEYIEHSHDLDTLLTVHLREMGEAAACRFKRQITEALVFVLRRLHERGFTHRDLKASNVMVQWNPSADTAPRVLLVDLDGVRHVRRPAEQAVVRALARLSVSLEHCWRVTWTDRLRFLKRYLARPGCPDPQWRGMWKAIEAEASRKRAGKLTGI